ncbi:multiple inositol polyphosphate phosphatase 1 isoform X1 [Fopius arisanus]|uniref:Multiple inositol polyphosphate phosphatase 1 n=1 Tax=Fopius arisanus TaxID=64838 RepID=A0A9R1TG24_9HYME|nr:PREDICTED: multiple inositol polyphosphate phosphatase 1-like isoform X1 [Fopius arisanus]
MRIFLCLIFLATHSLPKELDYCFANEEEPYLYFGSKTPYRIARPRETSHGSIPNCKPVQIWMLARHGTRYPQKGAVQRMEELPEIRDRIIRSHEEYGRGRLCHEDLKKLKEWSPHDQMTLEYASKLAPEGWREGNELGKRLRNAYPDLISAAKNVNSKNYTFRSIRGARSESSMIALMEGLFEDKDAVEPVPTPRSDALLRGDQNCRRWAEEKKGTYEERDGFIDGREYHQLQQNVSRRIGFDVSPETIHNMQDICRFETAWSRDELSPWCAVFSKDEWKILEYIDDLQYYYASGYGLQINSLIGCFPLQDLFSHFRDLEDPRMKTPKGVFYLSTSRILMDFLHTIDIAKDSERLLANNFRYMANRKWRVSLISPFFSNFVAVFHRCEHSEVSNKVTFYLNDELVMYEGCEEGICDWDYLKKKLGGRAVQCSENCRKREINTKRNNKTSSEYRFFLHIFLLIILQLLLAAAFHRRIMDSLQRITRFISWKFGFRKLMQNNIKS